MLRINGRSALTAASLAAAGAMMLSAGAAVANPLPERSTCMPRGDIHAQLGQRFAEVPVAVALSDNGSVLEILAAKDGATWTIIVTLPTGLSCLVAAGEAFQTLPARVAGRAV
jgi:hypothetical protein